MHNVRIKIKVNDYIIDSVGILENNILKVKTENEYIEFNYQVNILTKETKETRVTIDFNNKELTYELIQERKKINNKLSIISLTNDNKNVIINYRIEDESFLLEINYETI